MTTQETPTMLVSKALYRSGRARTTMDESAKAAATAAARRKVDIPAPRPATFAPVSHPPAESSKYLHARIATAARSAYVGLSRPRRPLTSTTKASCCLEG
ncbi:MAG: hypothetical protein C4307_02495 [Chloroflexota bacterium]